ncbi:unannotated protein [freshwater metagenome]|uniref:Unannotated protein n=1 Tax=freshwater metagenome TaxID=449393 RepID=A0A6J7KZ96_9ZZZZ
MLTVPTPATNETECEEAALRAVSSHLGPDCIGRVRRFLGSGVGRVRRETCGDPRCDPERGVNKVSH